MSIEIDLLHDQGFVPDWAWIQQNGKTAQENYIYQKKKWERERSIREQVEEQEKVIDEVIQKGIDKALQEIFKRLE